MGRLLIPPGMEDVFLSGIKRERIAGGLVRLYFYQERPNDPDLGVDLEDCSKRLEVIMIVVCKDTDVEQLSTPLAEDVDDIKLGPDIKLN